MPMSGIIRGHVGGTAWRRGFWGNGEMVGFLGVGSGAAAGAVGCLGTVKDEKNESRNEKYSFFYYVSFFRYTLPKRASFRSTTFFSVFFLFPPRCE